MKRIYADNAATTKLSFHALLAMNRINEFYWGNPSSAHEEGRAAREKLEECRERCAVCLDCEPNEIIFTSGATEGNNTLLYHSADSDWLFRVMTSAVEHPSMLNHALPFVPVDSNGTVHPGFQIDPKTRIVSVMTANNEIGTIQPVKEIADFCKSKRIPFHTDATAAVGHIPVSFREIGAQYLTCSAHKFHGPRGVGILIAKRNAASLGPLFLGGKQEHEMRAGTENLPAIAGMTIALEESCLNMEENAEKTKILRDRLIDGLLEIKGSILNGDPNERLPGNVNISFDGIEGEALLTLLDAKGISASAGSACHTGTSEPSHVLTAIGRTREQANAALRLTIDETNTDEEIDTTIRAVRESVEYLRRFTIK